VRWGRVLKGFRRGSDMVQIWFKVQNVPKFSSSRIEPLNLEAHLNLEPFGTLGTPSEPFLRVRREVSEC
jgi:hypothetical protein